MGLHEYSGGTWREDEAARRLLAGLRWGLLRFAARVSDPDLVATVEEARVDYLKTQRYHLNGQITKLTTRLASRSNDRDAIVRLGGVPTEYFQAITTAIETHIQYLNGITEETLVTERPMTGEPPTNDELVARWTWGLGLDREPPREPRAVLVRDEE